MKQSLYFCIKNCSLLVFFTGHVFGASLYLPENHPVNGGLTIIPIASKQKPEVYYNQKKITVLAAPEQNLWLLIIGIPIDTNKTIQTLSVNKPYRTSIPFHISEKYYAIQSLTIANTRKVDPYPTDLQRIAQETKEMAAIYAGFTSSNPYAHEFKAPAHARISSLFGLKRIYNEEPRPPHLGLDIAARANSNVSAVGDGRVVSTNNYFYTGNTVILDHGMGVFSLYGHLKRIDVTLGQNLKQGTEIGIVGQTGRATGPHLHWSMIVNQTYVDPLLFVPVRLITNDAATKTN